MMLVGGRRWNEQKAWTSRWDNRARRAEFFGFRTSRGLPEVWGRGPETWPMPTCSEAIAALGAIETFVKWLAEESESE